MAARKTAKKTPEEAQETPPTFEESMERLANIVEELEGGDLSLEDSLRFFEEGVRLARSSQTRLDEAEARVEELLGMSEDGPITEELEPK
jgi:exodeoxyribonuclease VII small subunit